MHMSLHSYLRYVHVSFIVLTGTVCAYVHNSRCPATHIWSPDDTSSSKGRLPTISLSLSQRWALDLLRCAEVEVTTKQPPWQMKCVWTCPAQNTTPVFLLNAFFKERLMASSLYTVTVDVMDPIILHTCLIVFSLYYQKMLQESYPAR